MILIAQIQIPMESLKQAAELYRGLSKLPASVQMHGPYFWFHKNKSLHALATYRFTEKEISVQEKRFIEKRLTPFRDIPGSEVDLTEAMDLPETLEALQKPQ